MVKSETASCSFVRVWLIDGENSSQHRESWHALLFSKCGFKYMMECLKSLHARLLIKLASNFTIKFKF